MSHRLVDYFYPFVVLKYKRQIYKRSFYTIWRLKIISVLITLTVLKIHIQLDFPLVIKEKVRIHVYERFSPSVTIRWFRKGYQSTIKKPTYHGEKWVGLENLPERRIFNKPETEKNRTDCWSMFLLVQNSFLFCRKCQLPYNDYVKWVWVSSVRTRYLLQTECQEGTGKYMV